MRKFYMVFWWLCVIQWPLFAVFFFNDSFIRSLGCVKDTSCALIIGLFSVYMMFSLVLFSPLTIILTLVLLNKVRLKQSVSKFEISLAVISCGFSLCAAYYFLFVMGGKLVG